MATLDVSDVQVLIFTVDTAVTIASGTYTALAGERYQAPLGATSMTVDNTSDVLCMLARKNSAADARNGLQAMSVDVIRNAV